MDLEEDVVSLLKQTNYQTDEILKMQGKLLECQNKLLDYQHENRRLIRDLGDANQKVQQLSGVIKKLSATANKETKKNETLNKRVDKLKKEIENKDIIKV